MKNSRRKSGYSIPAGAAPDKMKTSNKKENRIMLNTIKKVMALTLAIFFVFSLAACGKENSTPNYEELINAFVPSEQNTFSLNVGGSHKPNRAGTSLDGVDGVYSSNEAVVTVSYVGEVTAVGEGTAYVVITVDKVANVYRYDVTAAQAGTDSTTDAGVSYDEMIDSFVSTKLNTFSLQVGGEHKPGAALWLQSGAGSVYSSDESVVTVSDLGKVTAVGEGTAYVVIKSMTLFEVYRYDVTAEGK